MVSGHDSNKLQRLLQAAYHKDNFYMVHLDKKALPGQVQRTESVFDQFFGAKPANARMLRPSVSVSWGGYTLTLAAVFGIATALQWNGAWDYFINLSASDYPTMSQDDIRNLLGGFAGTGTSFLDGNVMHNYDMRWYGVVDDQGVYRGPAQATLDAMHMLYQRRPRPQRFLLYKGEFWVALHRSFCLYVHQSPDNVARTLQAYFSSSRVSDESFFQTVACHPEGWSFPVHYDNLRHTNWQEDGWKGGRRVDKNGNPLLHPEAVKQKHLFTVMGSGALFARKFALPGSEDAYRALLKALRDKEKSARTAAIAAERLRPARAISGRLNFCNLTGEWDPGGLSP